MKKDWDATIDGMNNWYEIKLKGRKVIKIWDSLKKYPGMSVEQLGQFLGIGGKDEKPDFDRYIPTNYIPSNNEIKYCIRDSEIVAHAIEKDFDAGLTSMTLASDCFKFGKELCLNGRFYRDYFPELGFQTDEFCRLAYKGGFTYLNPIYVNKEVQNISVFDVNSLYPWVMSECPLPYGYPIFTLDKPDNDILYIVSFKTQFVLKKNKIPTIQIKNTLKYNESEYLDHSDGEETLFMTNIDYNIFKEHYRVLDEHDHCYMMFNSKIGLLKPHVDYWMKEKIKYDTGFDEFGNKCVKNKFMRYKAKTMMNGFYGKTSTRTERDNRIPKMLEDGTISYAERKTSDVTPIYVPYGVFVTSWARNKTIRSAQKYYKNFIYADTDSLHLLNMENPLDLEIHRTKLGAWKRETEIEISKDKYESTPFEYGKYIRQKVYCHASNGPCPKGTHIKEIVDLKTAGLSYDGRTGIDFENFGWGLEIKEGNSRIKTVKGGAIIERGPWKLEDEECITEEIDSVLMMPWEI